MHVILVNCSELHYYWVARVKLFSGFWSCRSDRSFSGRSRRGGGIRRWSLRGHWSLRGRYRAVVAIDAANVSAVDKNLSQSVSNIVVSWASLSGCDVRVHP
jgi:hypothetical protein